MDRVDFSQQLTKVGALERFDLCLLRNPRIFDVLNLLMVGFVLFLVRLVDISRRPNGCWVFTELGSDSRLNSLAFCYPGATI